MTTFYLNILINHLGWMKYRCAKVGMGWVSLGANRYNKTSVLSNRSIVSAKKSPYTATLNLSKVMLLHRDFFGTFNGPVA